MNRHSQYRHSAMMDLKPDLDKARDEYYSILNCLDECRKDGYTDEDLKDMEAELSDAKEKYLELKRQYGEIENN